MAVSPLVVSAQGFGVGGTLPSVPANATIDQLEALIVQLTQILNQLLSLRHHQNSQPAITITSPVGTASWTQNTVATWTWTSSGSVPSVDIYLEVGNTPYAFATSYPNDGSFQWNVGVLPSAWKIDLSGIPNGTYTVAVCPAGDQISTPQCGEFTVNIGGTPYTGPAYQISYISPAVANVGSVVTLFGSNFDQYVQVYLANQNGGPESEAVITPKSVTPTSLTFVVPATNASQTNPSTVGANTVQVLANLATQGAVGGSRASNTVTLYVSGTPTTSFTATPTSGAAPFTVNFTAIGSGMQAVVNFGDGTTGGPTGNCVIADPVQGGGPYGPDCPYSHTYQSAGVYTATLRDVNGNLVDTATVTVTGNPTVTYISNSGSSVTGSYANVPAGSQIIVINQTSGQRVSGIGTIVSGSSNGTVTFNNLPSGSFYLEAIDSSGNYLAQSVVFYATAQTSAPTCTLTANPTTVKSGSATTLSWTSTNATSAAWIPDPSGKDNVPPTGTPGTSGSMSFSPPTILVGSYNPSEFLQVTGLGGTTTCSVNLQVVGSEQAAFDNGVFTQTSPTPTISGTASGVTQVGVVLSSNGNKAYGSGLIPVVSGHWSVTVSPALANGAYFINVYDASNSGLVNGGYLNVTNPTPPANSTVTYVSNAGGSVTGSYANLPAGSQIVVINVTSNQPVSGVTAAVSGSGTVTLNNLPAGSFYLKAQDAAGNYLAQSVTFYSAGSTASSTTGTCTRTVVGAGVGGGFSTPTTISISGGASACSAYCSSLDAESGTQSSCVYNDLSVNGSGNASVANALTALESALQGLEQWLGK